MNVEPTSANQGRPLPPKLKYISRRWTATDIGAGGGRRGRRKDFPKFPEGLVSVPAPATFPLIFHRDRAGHLASGPGRNRKRPRQSVVAEESRDYEARINRKGAA